jgi:hypothetical protein
MSTVPPRKRPSKKAITAVWPKMRYASPRGPLTPEQLTRDLLLTCQSIRYELFELDEYIGDVEAQAKRVRRLRPEQ